MLILINFHSLLSREEPSHVMQEWHELILSDFDTNLILVVSVDSWGKMLQDNNVSFGFPLSKQCHFAGNQRENTEYFLAYVLCCGESTILDRHSWRPILYTLVYGHLDSRYSSLESCVWQLPQSNMMEFFLFGINWKQKLDLWFFFIA